MRLYSYCFLLSLLSYCESSTNANTNTNTNTNTNSNDNSFHHFQDEHQQENNSSLSSATPNGPRLIGLDANGRMKCLLWSNPKTFVHPTLAPLFSSQGREREEDDINFDSDTAANQEAQSTQKREKPNEQQQQNTLPLSFMPGAVFATTDYRFRKERWYGVERIGTIFRWHLPSSSRSKHSNGNFQQIKHEGNNDAIFNHPGKRSSFMPTTIDIATSRSVFSSNTNSRKDHFVPFVDSGSLRVGWQQHDESSESDFGERRADITWFQLGFEHPCDDPSGKVDALHTTNNRHNRNGQSPFHLRLFFPLIRRRFDLQWTSRWGNGDSKKGIERDSEMENHKWSLKHRRPNDDPWWMPQVSLDPSMGTLSSENRYRNEFVGRSDRRYWAEFTLRLRTTVPTILSSVANSPIGPSDYGDDLQAASLRLDCSLITDLWTTQSRQPPCPTSVTTARFETVVIPSFWLRSVIETARLGLIHEQNHGVRK